MFFFMIAKTTDIGLLLRSVSRCVIVSNLLFCTDYTRPSYSEQCEKTKQKQKTNKQQKQKQTNKNRGG